ncbi:hypothetical protein JKF63_03682 [Porcisia hertigi]|uniref:MYND-type domain-containing protein n=1 Tax=Porcisia hertigi TaxID=2761500 RepID=A0A836L8A4_9TRYP|nr:hypothetical protein JKF63_03682 [Porcisia hertigi]
MTNKTVRALHLEGNELFEAGRLTEAEHAFRHAVDRFQADHCATKSAVDEFVKVAGNLCVCHHAMGDWHGCVKTARELLAIYPIVPKAYAAIGMCIVSRLLEQEAELQAKDVQHTSRMPPRSSEEVRRDVRRYLVKLGGVVCTADDAHACLCRAILLSEGALQVCLGPYLETSVRWVSEELLSAALSLEREYGDRVLGELSALDEDVCDAPPLLDVALVHIERPSIRILDAANVNKSGAGGLVPDGRCLEELPEAEVGTILPAVQEGHPIAQGGAAANSSSPAAEGDAAGSCTDTAPDGSGDDNRSDGSRSGATPPLDYFLSLQQTRVRVCHAERGGIPRGLTIARASQPFAVGQSVLLLPPADRTVVDVVGVSSAATPPASPTSPTSPRGDFASLHRDPANFSDAEGALALTALSSSPKQADLGAGLSMGGLSAADSMPLLTCNACGREVNPLHLSDAPPTGCPTCHGVVYCSSVCAVAYRDRHRRHECALRLVLKQRTEALAAVVSSTDPVTSLPPGDVISGGGWNALDLHRRILPLCITVYSGLRSGAPGAAEVMMQVRRGVQRRLCHAMPAEVADTLAEWVRALESAVEAPVGMAGATPLPTLPQDAGTSGLWDGHRADVAAARSSAGVAEESSLANHLVTIFFMVRLYAVDFAESNCSAFFTERLFLRHSCEPNCIWSDTLHAILTARFICKGEELTMAVDDRFPQHWPLQIRQKWFVHHHGVPCQCARCLREGANLHHTRGMLSSEIVEQLLTADIIDHPCPTPAHMHPTHLFHPQVQRLVEQSRSLQQNNAPALLHRLEELRAEVGKYLLPSHYLFEDIRHALLNVSAMGNHLTTCTTETQDSLLFWESLWAGAIPAKGQRLRLLPSIFECGHRRKLHYHQQRRRRHTRPPAVGASVPAEQLQHISLERRGSSSPTPSDPTSTRALCGRGRSASPVVHPLRAAGAGEGDRDASEARGFVTTSTTASTQRRPVPLPVVSAKNFASGQHIIDLFHGSYHTWYT